MRSARELTIYDNLRRDDSVAWKDLCRGPHVPHTGYIPAFALTRNSAAYWRGDQKNNQLQRLYGTAWPSREELRAHQTRLEEAAKRDHRKLGVELDLFTLPRGNRLRPGRLPPQGRGGAQESWRTTRRQRHIEAGYDFVNTPHQQGRTVRHLRAPRLLRRDHVPADARRRGASRRRQPEAQGQDYYLKPMNCPMHCLIFRSRGRSYRELPLRLFEFGSVYRYESPGSCTG